MQVNSELRKFMGASLPNAGEQAQPCASLVLHGTITTRASAMAQLAQGQHFHSLASFDASDLADILRVAVDLKERRQVSLFEPTHQGRVLGLYFEGPSLRTRLGFEAGMKELGGATVSLAPGDIGVGKRESLADFAEVVSSMVHAVAARFVSQERLDKFIESATVPVFNAGTPQFDPCQVLADVLTLKETYSDFSGLTIAFIGPAGAVCNSWLEIAATAGISIRAACPAGFEPDRASIQEAMGRGVQFKLTRSAEEAATGADILYFEPWPVPPAKQSPEEFQKPFLPFRISPALLKTAGEDVRIMHRMPVKYGQEFPQQLARVPQNLMLKQAENHLHMQKALLTLML